MKIFWSWQSDTPEQIGKYLVRDALKAAIAKLKQSDDIEEPTRDDLHLDQDTQGTTGSPDLVPTILGKIEKSEVVVADVTTVGKTDGAKGLINSNVAIELGYALRACTDARVILVFNKYYGTHEDLPFDLRHKGGAVVFDLSPEAEGKEISEARSSLADDFVRKLKPFLQLPPRVKEPLSLKAIIEHRLRRRYRLPDGGSDDVFELLVGVENNGELAASDFKLQVEIPPEFLDGGGHILRSSFANPGFARFEITNEDEPARIKHLYPGTTTPPLIMFNYSVKEQTKKQQPEALKGRVTATVFSGSMKPKETTMTIAELATIP
jgi:hypothetical protein